MGTLRGPVRWDGPEPVYRLVASLIVLVVRMLFRVRVIGAGSLPRAGAGLIAANHVSVFDPLILLAELYRRGRRARFLAVSDLWDIIGFGRLLSAGRMIPVVRGRGPEEMVEHAIAALDAAQLVVVYPEGHIAHAGVPAGETLPGKPGAGFLALQAGVPVVPVAFVGLRPADGRRLRLPAGRGRRWGLPARHVTLVVGHPLDLSWLAARGDQEAALEASEAILAEIRKLMASAPAPPGRRRRR